MLARVDQLNSRLRGDLLHPLRIGIGIHFGEAIVGAMGPPGSQVISAIGETANACSRLEGLTSNTIVGLSCRGGRPKRQAWMSEILSCIGHR